MQLRNGKTTGKREKQILEKPVLTRNPKIYITNPPIILEDKDTTALKVKEFISELKSMLLELNEWDLKEARIAGIVDIYDYILDNGAELKDSPRLVKFFATARVKMYEHLGELIESSFQFTDDEDTVINIKKATRSILAVARMLI